MEKGFQVEGILPKKTSKWIVLEHHVGYEARKIQERIMSKMEKKKKKNQRFLLSCHKLLVWSKQLFSNVHAIHFLGFHLQQTSV